MKDMSSISRAKAERTFGQQTNITERLFLSEKIVT